MSRKYTIQGCSQPHSPGWPRLPLSHYFLKFRSIFLIFPQNFSHFLPHFGPPMGIRHCLNTYIFSFSYEPLVFLRFRCEDPENHWQFFSVLIFSWIKTNHRLHNTWSDSLNDILAWFSAGTVMTGFNFQPSLCWFLQCEILHKFVPAA